MDQEGSGASVPDRQILNRQLDALKRLILIGSESDDLRSLLENIIRCALTLTDGDGGGVYFFDDASGVARLEAAVNLPDDFFTEVRVLPIDLLPGSHLLRKGRAVFFDDYTTAVPSHAERWGLLSAGSVPIMARNRVLGALNVASRRKRFFSPAEQEILELIGREVGLFITKLQAEAALRESEDLYRRLAEISPDAIVLVDENGKILMANSLCMQLGGFSSKAEVLAIQNPYDYFMPEDRERAHAIFADILKGIPLRNAGFRLFRKDGTVIPVEVNASLVPDIVGKPREFIAYIRDIRDRISTLQQLAHLAGAFRLANDGVLFTDINGVIQDLNQAAIKLLGAKTITEVVGRHTMSVLTVEDSGKAYALKDSLIDSGLLHHQSLNIKTLDGRKTQLEITAILIRDENEKPVSIVAVLRDIGEQRRIEEQARLLYDAVQLSSDGIVITDRDGHIQYINDALVRLYGAESREQLLGRNPMDVVIPMEREAMAAVNRTVLEKGSFSFPEYQVTTKSGKVIIIEISVVLLRNAQGHASGMLSICRDITERRQTEETLRQQQLKLRSLASELTLTEERERRRIATELHDHIGQSLILCKMKIEELRKHHDQARFREEIAEVSRRIDDCIQDTRSLIFDLSPPILYDLGLKAAIEWLIEELQKNFALTFDVIKEMQDLPIDIDLRIILFRVVREILLNVAKHSRATRLELSMRQEEGHVSIVVRDNGVGFDPARVLEHHKGKPDFGIFSIRTRLNDQGGDLAIDSAPGKGTQLVVTAPLTTVIKKKGRRHVHPHSHRR